MSINMEAKQFLLVLKFIYSEKATKFCEIFTLLLTTVHAHKIKVKISQNFMAFSEYMNFTYALVCRVRIIIWLFNKQETVSPV